MPPELAAGSRITSAIAVAAAAAAAVAAVVVVVAHAGKFRT